MAMSTHNVTLPPMAPETEQDLLDTERFVPLDDVERTEAAQFIDDEGSLSAEMWRRSEVSPPPQMDRRGAPARLGFDAWAVPTLLMAGSVATLGSVLAVGYALLAGD